MDHIISKVMFLVTQHKRKNEKKNFNNYFSCAFSTVFTRGSLAAKSDRDLLLQQATRSFFTRIYQNLGKGNIYHV